MVTLPIGETLQGSYNWGLVVLSLIIAIAASYAALDLAGRITAAKGSARLTWLAGGSFAMGSGIWAMHYVGMLAYVLPIEVRYDCAHRPDFARRRDPGLGRGALRGEPQARRAAQYRGRRRRDGPRHRIYALHRHGGHAAAGHVLLQPVAGGALGRPCDRNLDRRAHTRVPLSRCHHVGLGVSSVSAVIMGAAIPTMHYCGMVAVTFVPMSEAPDFRNSIRISSLGIVGIVGVTLMVLAIAIVTLAHRSAVLRANGRTQ